jgi:hypothetical protein
LVEKADLAPGDELALSVGDLDLPQLQPFALLDRGATDLQAAGAVGSEKVDLVVHAHGELASGLKAAYGADGAYRLDDRGIDASVHNTPRGVVLLGGDQVGADFVWRDMIEVQTDGAQERARGRLVDAFGIEAEGDGGWVSGHGHPERYASLL